MLPIRILCVALPTYRVDYCGYAPYPHLRIVIDVDGEDGLSSGEHEQTVA